MIDEAAYHETEMMRHFEDGRMASARWHCRIWTRLMAKKRDERDVNPVMRDVTQDKRESRGESNA